MNKDRELALVRDCQRGDREAMETLVRSFDRPVYRATFRMLGNRDDAADVTQTVFLKVFENIHRFDASFRLFSWVYRIAVNEAIDQLDRRRRDGPMPETEQAADDDSQDHAAAAQVSREVQGALMELQEDYRAVIVLRYFTECSYREIGEILQLPEKTVKSRLFTARQQLKCRLEQRGCLAP